MPSTMSIRTTSQSSLSTSRCAAVAPTLPAPITVTFLRAIKCLLGVRQPAAVATAGRSLLHVLDDRVSELARPQFRSAVHLPLEVVGDALLLNRRRDGVDD